MAIIGLGLGLPHHFWYSFLDRILPGTRLLSIARKIILDQAAFSPFANFFFFMGSGVLEGHSVQQSWKEFKTKFPMVYKVCIYFFFPFLNYNWSTIFSGNPCHDLGQCQWCHHDRAIDLLIFLLIFFFRLTAHFGHQLNLSTLCSFLRRFECFTSISSRLLGMCFSPMQNIL